MSTRLRIAISFLCAIASLLLVTMYADSIRAEAEHLRQEALERYGGEVVRLVVANTDLAQGEVISSFNTYERDWLVDLAPEGAFTSLDDCAGLEVRSPVAKGLPLTQLALNAPDTTLEVPAGLVAVSIALNDHLSLSNDVTPGAELFAYEVKEAKTTLIAQNIKVLAVPLEASSFAQTKNVTIAVPLDDVAAVLSAQTQGSLRLVVPAHDVDVNLVDTKTPAEHIANPVNVDAENAPLEGSAHKDSDEQNTVEEEHTDES